MIKPILLSLLFFSLGVISQEKKDIEIFSKENIWGKEILKFPLGFAREIPYEGYADIRFHKDWIKKDEAGFWSYVFAWHIKGNQKLTIQSLESYMKFYYDGLVDANKSDRPESIVIFIKSDSLESDYVGKMKIYDRFATNSVITLHVTLKSYYCKKKNMTTLVFRVSTKEFNQKIWKE